MKRRIGILASVFFIAVAAHAGTVTLQAGEGGVIRSLPSFTTCRNTCTTTQTTGHTIRYDVIADTYYQFVGWTGACAGVTSTTCDVQIKDNTVFGASFKDVGPAKATITLKVGGAGWISSCNSTCTIAVRVGDSFSFTAGPSGSTNYFAGWSGPCSGTVPTCTGKVAGDVTIGASFFTKGVTQ